MCYNGVMTTPTRVSRYRQLADVIADQIRRGEIAPGSYVPSAREMCRDLGVAMVTATRIQGELHATGMVYTEPGLGLVVLPREEWPSVQGATS